MAPSALSARHGPISAVCCCPESSRVYRMRPCGIGVFFFSSETRIGKSSLLRHAVL
jgi:hypothetical protein